MVAAVWFEKSINPFLLSIFFLAVSCQVVSIRKKLLSLSLTALSVNAGSQQQSHYIVRLSASIECAAAGKEKWIKMC